MRCEGVILVSSSGIDSLITVRLMVGKREVIIRLLKCKCERRAHTRTRLGRARRHRTLK